MSSTLDVRRTNLEMLKHHDEKLNYSADVLGKHLKSVENIEQMQPMKLHNYTVDIKNTHTINKQLFFTKGRQGPR